VATERRSPRSRSRAARKAGLESAGVEEPEEVAVAEPAGDRERTSFEQQARSVRRDSGGVLREFRYLLARNRKWWMTPIILSLLVVGLLVVASGTAVGPLIYALF
jgi:hypothetical protein